MRLKKDGTYTNSTGSLTFNPGSGVAYSYHWYQLVMRLPDGRWVLNTFAYSSTTVRHIWQMRRVLSGLGINDYLEIEAPRGLQNLATAITHAREEVARILIANKYGRTVRLTPAWILHLASITGASLAPTKAELASQEAARRLRLDRAKRLRASRATGSGGAARGLSVEVSGGGDLGARSQGSGRVILRLVSG